MTMPPFECQFQQNKAKWINMFQVQVGPPWKRVHAVDVALESVSSIAFPYLDV